MIRHKWAKRRLWQQDKCCVKALEKWMSTVRPLVEEMLLPLWALPFDYLLSAGLSSQPQVSTANKTSRSQIRYFTEMLDHSTNKKLTPWKPKRWRLTCPPSRVSRKLLQPCIIGSFVMWELALKQDAQYSSRNGSFSHKIIQKKGTK